MNGDKKNPNHLMPGDASVQHDVAATPAKAQNAFAAGTARRTASAHSKPARHGVPRSSARKRKKPFVL